MCKAAKLSWIMTYVGELLSIESHDFFWSWGLPRSQDKTKTIISSLQKCLSQDKLKPLYHHYKNFYHLQTWHISDLPWGAPIHVILLHHTANWKHYISITTKPMATTLDMVVTYSKEVSFINIHDPLIWWFCGVTWKIKYFILPLALDQWSLNTARWWLTRSIPSNQEYSTLGQCEVTWQFEKIICPLYKTYGH